MLLWSLLSFAAMSALSGQFRDAQLAAREGEVAGHPVIATFADAEYRKKGISLFGVRTMMEDRRGVIWLSDAFSLCSYDPDRNKWLNLTSDFKKSLGFERFDSVKYIAEDARGRIWVKTVSQGCAYFDGVTWHRARELFPGYLKADPDFFFLGNDAKLWFWFPEGLVGYDGEEWTQTFQPPIDIKWVYVQGRKGDSLPPNPHNSGDDKPMREAFCGFQNREGLIWLGSRNALLTFDPRTKNWELALLPVEMEYVYHIYEDRISRLWFGDLDSDIAVYNKHKNQWTFYNMATYFPQIRPETARFYQEKSGRMMLATDAGLLLFDEAQNKWKLFTANNSNRLLGYDLTCIMEDKRGRIWISAEGGILLLSGEQSKKQLDR